MVYKFETFCGVSIHHLAALAKKIAKLKKKMGDTLLFSQYTNSTGALGLGRDSILDFMSTPSFSNWHWEFLELTHQPLERKNTIPIKFFVNILNI